MTHIPAPEPETSTTFLHLLNGLMRKKTSLYTKPDRQEARLSIGDPIHMLNQSSAQKTYQTRGLGVGYTLWCTLVFPCSLLLSLSPPISTFRQRGNAM